MTLFSQALTKINGNNQFDPSDFRKAILPEDDKQDCISKLFNKTCQESVTTPDRYFCMYKEGAYGFQQKLKLKPYQSFVFYALSTELVLIVNAIARERGWSRSTGTDNKSMCIVYKMAKDIMYANMNAFGMDWENVNEQMLPYIQQVVSITSKEITVDEIQHMQSNHWLWWEGNDTPAYNKENNITEKPITNMDKITRTELKNVLKSKGVTKQWEQAAIMVFGSNPERYIDLAESIYAISRVIPAVESDSVREKMDKANREWIKLVVDKDFCPQLKSYTDQYGRELVKLAILDLMDNGLWETPVGNKGLKNKFVSNYDGLQMLPEAIEKVKGEMPECKEHEQEQEEPIELQVETMIAPDEQHIETDSSKRKSAIFSLKTMKDYMDVGLQNLTCLLDYLEKEDMVSLYEHENEQLRQQLAKKDADLAKAREQAIDAHDNLIADFEKEKQEMKDALIKENERLYKELNEKIESVKNVKAQLKIAHKNVADLKDQLYVETNDLRKQLNEMTDKYNDLSQQHDKLKELAKNATTPTCIIRFSELTGIDYIGRAAATQFVNFMEKRTKLIQFDKNK